MMDRAGRSMREGWEIGKSTCEWKGERNDAGKGEGKGYEKGEGEGERER